MTRLSTQATAWVPLPCQTAHDAFLSPSRGSRAGVVLLGLRHVWGRRDAPGSQTILRHAHGAFDLELKETVIEADPPLRFVADQLPLRLLPYDPAERLPPLGDENPGNPDRMFRMMFGKSPPLTRISLTFAPRAGGTDITLAAVRDASGLGWFGRRRMRKALERAIHDELQAFVARVGDRRRDGTGRNGTGPGMTDGPGDGAGRG